jgi:PmbA protein
MEMHREIYSTSTVETSASIARTSVESVRRKDIDRTGLRLYRDGLIGTAGVIGVRDEARLESTASKALEAGIEYGFEPCSDLVVSMSTGAAFSPRDAIVAEAEAVMKHLSTTQPGLIFSGVVQARSVTHRLENDLGLDLRSEERSLSFSLLFKEKTSTGIMDGFVLPDSPRCYDREAFLVEADAFCSAFSNRIELPRTGMLKMVFPGGDSGFLLSKLKSELSGLSMETGASLLSGRKGLKEFGPGFSLDQCRDPLEGLGPFFDAEGVVNRGFRVPLIAEGVVRSSYADKRTGARFGIPVTGAADSSYDGVPNLSPPPMLVRRSDRTLESLLDGDPGVIVVMAEGGDFTPEGAYATPVQLALLHDGTRYVGRLPEFQISSHLFRMFGEDFLGVSSDSLSALQDLHCAVIRMQTDPL